VAITLDGSTPAAVDNIASTSATAVTASFSPPAGSMVVIVVNVSFAGIPASITVTVTDSASTAYTAGPAKWDTRFEYSGIFTHQYASAPGSVTVTATRSATGSALFQVVPYVLDGTAASQSGAASQTSSSTSNVTAVEASVTTTVTGSWVITGAGVDNENTYTPVALSTDHAANDGTDSVSAAAGHAVTGTPGATTIGWTISGASNFALAALEILPTTTSAIALADEGAAADQMAAQITAIPPAVIAAPPRPSGPAPPPVPAQLLTVPAGAAMPQDAAGAAEAMAAGTVTVPLADAAGAAEFFSGGVMPADQAAASDALAVAAGIALPDPAGAATDLAGNVAAVQVSASDYGAAADLFQNTGLTEADAGAAADSLTAAVTVHIAEVAAAGDAVGQEPAIGASGGATIPRASPGTSQVAVAAPGTNQWYYLGSYGVLTALTYSYTCPGGCDSMTCTLMVPASYRNQIMDPGWQVRVWRGGHVVWDGRMDEPVPAGTSGWNFTAVGTGQRGTDFLAIYSDTWPTGQPDESINNAIARGLPWVNPGVGTPSDAWFGQAVDSGAQTITALLNLICTRGGSTWYVNSQPGGLIGDDLSVFPLPTVPNRLLICVTPVPRTLGGDINTIMIRYMITADNSTATPAVPATYGLAVAQNAASVAMHGELETYIDLSDVGVMSEAAAAAVGQNVLQIYQRASFAGPFVGNYGALMNMGGTPVDPGCDQAGSVVRLILTDFGYGGELVPGTPIQFIVGSYEWDDFSQTFTLSAMNTLDQSLTGMLQMENTVLTPITVAST